MMANNGKTIIQQAIKLFFYLFQYLLAIFSEVGKNSSIGVWVKRHYESPFFFGEQEALKVRQFKRQSIIMALKFRISLHYQALSMGFLLPKVRPQTKGNSWLFLSSTIFSCLVMQFRQKGGFVGCPLSGRKTAKVCWQPLKVRYYRISSLMIRFSFERSGLVGGESLRVLNISARILARICERTPLSSRVYLRTSLSSLMEAMQFKYRLLLKLLMRAQSPKSLTSTKQVISKGIEVVTSQAYLPERSRVGSNRATLRQPSHDLNYALQNYVQGRSSTFYAKIPSFKYIKHKRHLLAETEEKIFSEVIGLVGEIEEIKTQIVFQLESIKLIQIQNPDVEEKMRYHGYGQPLTLQQCNDLQEENAELIHRIQQISAKQDSTLDLALAAQKAQYQQLKDQLTQNVTNQTNAPHPNFNQLNGLIAELQRQRSSKFRINYPGIDRLEAQNQDLRQRTIAFLKVHQLETQEQRELSEYLARDEHNRMEFLQELKKFKGEFKRIKQQNQTLKQRLARKDQLNSKQNSGSKFNTSKIQSNKSSLQVESVLGKKKDRLSEYESFIRLMQQNVRG